MSFRTVRGAVLLVGMVGPLLLVGGCGPEPAHEAFPSGAHGEAGGEGEHGAGTGHGAPSGEAHAPAEFAHIVPNLLAERPSVPAVEVTGPEGRHFRVVLRTPEVGYFPCTSCHVRPIGTKSTTLAQMHAQVPAHEGAASIDCGACHNPNSPGGLQLDCTECHEREDTRDLMPSRTAHLTIRLGHPSGHYRNCLTCHAPEDPGSLMLQDGTRATLDEAYRLCAGCHFMQADDWAGGAHGKRLAGWQGERVILSCTGCHDPHDPLFPQRRPVTFPKIARREGG